MTENSSASTITDGKVTFSNSDHLEWDQKKHDIMLNLGFTSNSSEADQTPTPTRFIRNCEEVGLFQDLQNVNPFDEVFKKAVENPTVSLKVPVSSSDDTLHTPQIYPHLEDNPKFYNTTTSETTPSISNVYSLNGLIESIEPEGKEGDNPLIIILEPENDEKALNHSGDNKTNASPIKVTSKETYKDQIKEQVKAAIMQKTTQEQISLVPIDKLLLNKHEPKTTQNHANTFDFNLLKQREANKAAQIRCRKRKQREFEEMSSEIHFLRTDNSRLRRMNLNLQETIRKLEAKLKRTKSSSSLECVSPVLSASITPAATLPIVSQARSEENKQMKSNLLPLIAPKTDAATASSSLLPVTMQNIQSNLNNTVVILCPRYVPSQNIIIPPMPILTQPVSVKSKSNYKKIVPK